MPTDPPDLATQLAQLGFRAGRDALAAFLTHAHKSRFGPTESIEALVELERRARAATNLASRTRAAYLGAFKPIDRFDWAHPRKIDRGLIERLAHPGLHRPRRKRAPARSIRRRQAMLAKNLGHAALLAGKTVRFTTVAAALADLLQQESLPAFERRAGLDPVPRTV
jgi:hypothetical protein